MTSSREIQGRNPRTRYQLGKKGHGRSALEAIAIAGDAIACFSRRVTRRVLAQSGPITACDRNDSEVKRGTRKHHAPMLWVHRAMLRRRGENGSAGTRHPPIRIHHCAVVLTVATTARR